MCTPFAFFVHIGFRLPEIFYTMLSRYFTAIAFLILCALVIRNLLTRRQQRAVSELVSLTAKVIVVVSLLALAWRLFFQAA